MTKEEDFSNRLNRLLREYGFNPNSNAPESICPYYQKDCDEPYCELGDCQHPEFLLLMDLAVMAKYPS